MDCNQSHDRSAAGAFATRRNSRQPSPGAAFRVWMVGYRDWQPADCHDVPPEAEAIEPVEVGCLSRREAAEYVEQFNRTMLTQPARLWALAVPVEVRYVGDLLPGDTVLPGNIVKAPVPPPQ